MYYYHHHHHHLLYESIYTYIPEINYVPREHGVAAILLLLFMVLTSLLSVLKLLYFYISTFRSMCAVPNMAVFCSSFIIIIIIIIKTATMATENQSPVDHWKTDRLLLLLLLLLLLFIFLNTCSIPL